ncbi:hypothetical protein F5Y17DRAFT_39046 [Xylariaceae sp. FL0594]|nr:hypothetical protein F5Y17DRAFT_39046 [Xylariaceae sp. FL0594]
MDEPDGGCFWQAWKFGMKREDLYTKLQDQYNTVTLSIQDPDAFHHDVCEISKTAADLTEFHRLLEERKQLRLEQLNESLQSASVEIIANPDLIGTDQWQHAIQLFRTKSFDSLVRYFSSYLPEDHEWNPASNDHGSKPFFDGLDDHEPIMTHEPLSFISGSPMNMIPTSHFPPSPRSLTMCSDSSKASTPSRTLSFSEPETDTMALSTTLTQGYDDETSQWDEPDTPTTPLSETFDMHPSDFVFEKKRHDDDGHDIGKHTAYTASLSPCQEEPPQDAPTPTPHEINREVHSSIEEAPTHSVVVTLPRSPAKYTPLEQRVRENSPGLVRGRRRSPEIGRIQKPSTEASRSKARMSLRKGAGYDCSLVVKRQ